MSRDNVISGRSSLPKMFLYKKAFCKFSVNLQKNIHILMHFSMVILLYLCCIFAEFLLDQNIFVELLLVCFISLVICQNWHQLLWIIKSLIINREQPLKIILENGCSQKENKSLERYYQRDTLVVKLQT